MREMKYELPDCLQEEPAFCTVVCPFHLDMRDFIEKMQRSSFNSAFKVYRDAVGFPGIVAELCHEPCREVCPRRDKDGAAAVKLLEKASINHAKNCNPNAYNIPRKDKKIGIIGAGISGLACALRLASKKYDVTVYEQSDRLGGHLWGVLPPELFLEDIERQFQYEKYTLVLNTLIENIDDLKFDAVYVATGAGGSDFGLKNGMAEHTFASNRKGVFLGGSLLGAGSVDAIAQGLAVANHIESYLKTGIMSGPIKMQITKMEVCSREISFSDPVLPAEGNRFNQAEAKAEADRCLRCSCDACQKHCDLIQHYKKKPKQIFDEVRATTGLDGIRGKITVATKLIATCNQCGLCKDTCPQNIDMGKLLLEGRRELHRKSSLPWAYHDFFLRDMAAANNESAHMVGVPKGYPESEYVFFPGCQLGASDPAYVSESYRLLLEHKPDTALMLSCCGAPAVWSGDEKIQEEMFGKIKDEWSSLGKPTVIFACTTCRKMFRDYLPEIKGVYLYDILLQWGAKPRKNMGGQLFSVFDPCTSRNEPALQQTIRELAKNSGCLLEPLPYEGSRAQCCSFGGQVSIANPAYVKSVVKKRIGQNSNPYITYCTNCRDVFAAEGKPALHILDIIFDLNDKLRTPPTITDRQKNRIELKRTLLKQFWNEEVTAEPGDSSTVLLIRPELKEKLNRELILEADIIAAVEYCESNGNKVEDPVTGSFFGYLQIEHFTYWVEYRPTEGGFELINAYCHRMRIVTEDI
ncbi:MAG TPA: FAD-dependent oxidoreductase [Anaerovoracaceae bacterium]|nr:FAD-dependent oxidoreductase [Anaerovoracaceae bacterium]